MSIQTKLVGCGAFLVGLVAGLAIAAVILSLLLRDTVTALDAIR